MRSSSQHSFARIPQIRRPRSAFVRNGNYKTTFDSGYLVPFYFDEVLPGDTFNVKASMFARMATPIFPVMDNLYLDTHWFFVPNRLVWENWEKFQGQQENPEDSTDFTVPQIDAASITATPAVMSLWDYFALPMQGANALTQPDAPNALFFRAYNLIYNQWYRDQDLQDSVVVNKDDGPDSLADYGLLRRGVRKDYFTSCRPAPQKGPAIDLPIGGTASVLASGNINTVTNGLTPTMNTTGSGTNWANAPLTNTVQPSPGNLAANAAVSTAPRPVQWGNETGQMVPEASLESVLSVNMSSATGPTINALREAITLQQAYELDMRGGTRYTESLLSRFGVVNPDFRLQRPELIGEGHSMVNIHPIAQTSESDGTPQGNLSAFGTVAQGNGFSKTFTEHGLLIGLMSVRADMSYQEMLEKMWSRQTRWDYYEPIFANLGEQAVLNKEIFVNSTATNMNDVFGYQERWGEYRYSNSRVTGLFRSSAAQSLDAWHLSRDFGNTIPTLNDTFIQENPPVDRVIAVDTEPHFIFDSYIENRTSRVMPMYGNPGLLRL